MRVEKARDKRREGDEPFIAPMPGRKEGRCERKREKKAMEEARLGTLWKSDQEGMDQGNDEGFQG